MLVLFGVFSLLLCLLAGSSSAEGSGHQPPETGGAPTYGDPNLPQGYQGQPNYYEPYYYPPYVGAGVSFGPYIALGVPAPQTSYSPYGPVPNNGNPAQGSGYQSYGPGTNADLVGTGMPSGPVPSK